jgi:hypothetical protein
MLKLTDFGTSITREDVMKFVETEEESSITVRWTVSVAKINEPEKNDQY